MNGTKLKGVLSGFGAAIALLAAMSPVTAADALLTRAAHLQSRATRAEAIATMGMEPTAIDDSRFIGGLEFERLHFEDDSAEVVCTLMFNRVIAVSQTVRHDP